MLLRESLKGDYSERNKMCVLSENERGETVHFTVLYIIKHSESNWLQYLFDSNDASTF